MACEERYLKDKDDKKFMGKIAIATLKGDVDNLGTIFKGLQKPTFAKMAALSRQIDHFLVCGYLLIVQKNTLILILFLQGAMISL